MSESIYLATLGIPLAAVIAVFAMKYVSAVLQARARFASEESYRELAEKAVAAQAEAAQALAAIQATLADLRGRIVTVEKILKEVE